MKICRQLKICRQHTCPLCKRRWQHAAFDDPHVCRYGPRMVCKDCHSIHCAAEDEQFIDEFDEYVLEIRGVL